MSWTKESQLAAQGGLCFYCDSKIESLKRQESSSAFGLGTTDHAIPTSRGGLNVPENLVIACHMCNIHKRDMTPAQFIASKIAVAEKLAYRKGYRAGLNMGGHLMRRSTILTEPSIASKACRSNSAKSYLSLTLHKKIYKHWRMRLNASMRVS